MQTNKIPQSNSELGEDVQAGIISRTYKIASNFKRIYHYHIRKTGGTSINFAFLATCGETEVGRLYQQLAQKVNHRLIINNKVYVGWNTHLIQEGNYYYAFSHSPAHEINLLQDTFTITCLRDPARRVISHYHMLKHYAEAKINHPCMTTEGHWLGNSFDEFLYNMPKEHLLRQIYMFSKTFNINEAAERIINCSFYMFTEQLAAAISNLSVILDINLPLGHEAKSVYKSGINDATLIHLKEMLQEEYKMLEMVKKNSSANNFF